MVNTCSIRNKTDEFLHHNIESNYDVCFVTETWLQDDNPIDKPITEALQTNSHSFINCPRSATTRGGGLGVFYKKSLKVEVLNHHIHSTFELLLCNIQYRGCSVLAMCLYRPPYSSNNRKTVPMFISEFTEVCSTILAKYGDRRLIIVGDFNIHMDEPHSPDTKSFMEILDTFGWQQLVCEATHTSGHILDLCITSDSGTLRLSTPTIDHFISDHAFVSFLINIPKPPIHKLLVNSRALSRINKDQFRRDLIKLTDQLLATSSITDVNQTALQYDKILKQLLDKHAPLKTRMITPRTCVAWFDTEAKRLKAKLRKQEKIWRKSKNPEDLQDLKTIRNSYRHHLRVSKIAHFNESIKSARGNSRQLFSITMGLMGKVKTNILPDSSDDSALATEFADFFIEKITKIRDELRHVPRYTPSEGVTSKFSCFTELSQEQTSKLIKSSKPTTCNTDPIPSSIIKENSDILASLITLVINQSLQQSTFSNQWKLATVKPLLKKSGLEPTLNNYRPVSNLSFISKLVERCAVSQLNDYLSAHNLHSGHQSAYKECFSTETALCSLMDQLLWSLENKRATVVVSLDLSAAFDTVDHGILTEVLESCFGITSDALGWIRSYLRDRKLCVTVRESQSEVKCFNFSVPQGSCLGPMLFNLYCSTITECINEEQSIGGYADDHCLIDSFDPSKSDDEVTSIGRLETSLQNISTWMASNKLKMNPTKTETTIFVSKGISNKISTSSIQVAGNPVQTSDHLKYLGVWFDQHLTMEKHIASKCSAATINIRCIAAIRRFIDLDTAKLLASSLVLTHLDYSNSVLCGLPKKSIMRLQRIQNWAAKVVLQRDKFSSSDEALIFLHWLPVKERIDFKILCIIYKCLHNSAPLYLSSRIKRKSFARATRASKDGITLEVPYVKKSTFAARAFSVYGPNLWNTLSASIQQSPSLETFKRSLKTELFIRAFKSHLKQSNNKVTKSPRF